MKSNKYYGVSYYKGNPRTMGHNKKRWSADVMRNGVKMRGYYHTEREAAIAVDKYLISQGEEPRNILKKTNK